jgi:hypothetical protein
VLIPGTSDHKSEAIEEDGRDPDFAKKLNTIGQVNVPEFKTKYRPVSILRYLPLLAATLLNCDITTVRFYASNYSPT